jgi:hypothetical protein
METQPLGKAVSKGSCAFCKAELAKNKMTQHLKFCKQRLASIASQEEKSQGTKTRLFHILAEGRYNPQYWLHFEVPTSKSLWSVDGFLKDMWIDDLDHLSGFTINGTNYSDDYPDDYFVFSEGEEENEVVEEEVAEEEEPDVGKLLDEFTSLYWMEEYLGPAMMDRTLSTWLAELKKPHSVDELIDYLKEELSRGEKERRQIRNHGKEVSPEEHRKAYFRAESQKLIVESLLEAVEDRTMGASLARVLKVGQKVSYIYDYGSSTYINLKVIGEREGIVENEKEPVQLLVQNTAPVFACSVCGKPATTVALGYYGESIADSVYCDECAEEQVEEGGTLPITNSPRVGVL